MSTRDKVILFLIVAICTFVAVRFGGPANDLPNLWFFITSGCGIGFAMFAALHPKYRALRKANKAYRNKDFATAANICEQAIEKMPKQADLYVTAAAAYEGLKQPEKALEMCNRGLKLNPRNALLWNNRAVMQIRLGRPIEALHDSQHAINLTHLTVAGTAMINQTYGASLIANCKYKEALERAEVMKARGDKDRAALIRALALYRMNEFEESLTLCDKVLDRLSVKSLLPELLFVRGIGCLALGKYDDALTSLTSAVAHEPASAEYLIGRAHCYAVTRKYAEAVADLATAEACGLSLSEKAFVLSNRARISLLKGNVTDAASDAEAAIALQPKSPAVLATHGLVLCRQGNHQQALADLCTAIQIDPYYAEAYRFRYELHVALGEEEKAAGDRSIAEKYKYRPYL